MRYGTVLLMLLAGGIVGILVLHPMTMVICWFESHGTSGGGSMELWLQVPRRLWLSFTPRMLPMTGVYALLGGVVSLALVVFHRALSVRDRTASNLRQELVEDLPLIIAGGETEKIEFKESARWDSQLNSVNRSLETVVVKTLAGLLNGSGGSLILGVGDSGEIMGLERDYKTLKRPDRDGYEQYLMGVVEKRLGGDLCPLVHLVFTRLGEADVCRVVVEPASRPVYLEESGSARLYLRMGNSTRRLDVREAIEYVSSRWTGRLGRSVLRGFGRAIQITRSRKR